MVDDSAPGALEQTWFISYYFRQQRALAPNEVEELANDLAALYNQTDDKAIIFRLTNLVRSSPYMLVQYVEYLEGK